jgi:hypothetical protein
MRSRWRLNPPHCFLRELVEGDDALLQMFFLGVLDFVVADTVQTLDEHHHGGNSGGGNFRRIVQRPAGQAVNLAARLTNGFVAQRDKFVVERARRDLPKAFPRNFDVAFLGKFFAGDFGFSQHLGELGGIEMALVERDAAFLDDAGNDAGLGRA